MDKLNIVQQIAKRRPDIHLYDVSTPATRVGFRNGIWEVIDLTDVKPEDVSDVMSRYAFVHTRRAKTMSPFGYREEGQHGPGIVWSEDHEDKIWKLWLITFSELIPPRAHVFMYKWPEILRTDLICVDSFEYEYARGTVGTQQKVFSLAQTERVQLMTVLGRLFVMTEDDCR